MRAAAAEAQMRHEVAAARTDGARERRMAKGEAREAAAAAEARMREYMERFREQVRGQESAGRAVRAARAGGLAGTEGFASVHAGGAAQ